MDYTGKIISKNPPQPTQASASGVWTLDEAAAAVKNNSWPIPGVPNPISKSLRFNSADSAYLNRTPGSAGNRKTFTWSGWVKRSALGTGSGDASALVSVGTNTSDDASLYFSNTNSLVALARVSSSIVLYLISTQVFRDVSSWYHVVIAVDTTQTTASNRVKMYVNGTQITSFSTETYPNQNQDLNWNNSVSHDIGRFFNQFGAGSFFNGYLTEVYFIDGQALTPSSFGQTNANTGVWEPKPYTGTYGGNGFYLNFKDSATTTALGYDYSGNGNNWTPNNFSVTAGAGNDSLTDVPTQWIGYNTSGDTGGIWRGNYATLNPLSNLSSLTLANGNLDGSRASAAWASARATFGMSSGKWYWEVTPITGISPGSTTNQIMIGISLATASSAAFYDSAGGWGYYYNDGNKWNNNSGAAYGSSYTNNDVIGVAFNADSGELKFYKNGTVQNSGTAAYTGLTSGPYFPTVGLYGTSSFVANFGQRPFAYAPPAGFLSLCTTNLPIPTIGATSTTQANDYFNTVLYTGDGANPRTITGVGFQPDLVWVKRRNGVSNNFLQDAVRGVTSTDSRSLVSNATDAETNYYTVNGGVTAFTSDGFTTSGGTTNNNLNNSGNTMVAWNWKANGAGSTNTSGTITSTVSANTTAGFSIVTYTGTGANATVGHGCLVNNVATAPSMIIIKNRTGSGVSSGWGVYHVSLGATKYLALEQTAAAGTSSALWNDTAPTSTVFSLGTEQWVNTNGGSQLAYCFAQVAGYSAFGSYTGNGSADGPFVYTGFKPAWVLVKQSSAAGEGWRLIDATRSPYNVANRHLLPNSAAAESTETGWDMLSNGFKLRSADAHENANGATYIYAAFAENPFKYSLAR